MKFNERLVLWAGVILSALLLTLPYLVPHTGLLMLVALLPLLEVERIITSRGIKRGWIYHYTTFLLWNIFTTYWIYNATLPGAIVASVFNSLQMSLIFGCFRWFKKRYSPSLGYLFLVLGWLAWEHFYFDAEISWPWLVLGNGFATSIKSIQWYEYTGALGGSLWTLLSNVLLFTILSYGKKLRATEGKKCGKNRGVIIALSLYSMLVLVPVIVSHIIYAGYNEKENPKEFVVIQPNIDPYEDKFGGMTRDQQDNILVSIAKEAVTPQTSMIVAPETFTSDLLENTPFRNRTMSSSLELLRETGVSDILFGAQSFYFYPMTEDGNAPTYTARKMENFWYDSFNTAVFLDSTGKFMFYHKSKLVVSVEYQPYPKYLPFLSSLMIDLGGATGSYGTQKERAVHTSLDGSVKIGAAICYESIYGDYYRDYILKGANVMAIITNDGWWGNTPGYMQHLRYASLRAIETRRSIVRSANTGVSALIDQRGDIVKRLGWWERGYLRGDLNLNDKITVFVKYGDYIGRVAYVSMLLFIGLAILSVLKIYGKGRG
jgi:apolipoprotein N-acyltransferase